MSQKLYSHLAYSVPDFVRKDGTGWKVGAQYLTWPRPSWTELMTRKTTNIGGFIFIRDTTDWAMETRSPWCDGMNVCVCGREFEVKEQDWSREESPWRYSPRSNHNFFKTHFFFVTPGGVILKIFRVSRSKRRVLAHRVVPHSCGVRLSSYTPAGAVSWHPYQPFAIHWLRCNVKQRPG